ncbi:MAG: rhomboid family intramembrane serine protease [Deltaproteobacteria bacterium]|nr:rhomboid family intramembrane serine protease [Deltaproteobacteria bacterium]
MIGGFLTVRWVNLGAPVLVDGVTAVPDGAVISGDVYLNEVDLARPAGPGGRLLPGQRGLKKIYAHEGGPGIAWQPVQAMDPISDFFHFSTYELVFGAGFWRLIGFQFLHGSLQHLLFNMLGLFFFGSMVEQHLGSKRYLAFYLLCGICGALMYGVLNLGGWIAGLFGVHIPGLLMYGMATPLIGASAGVFGILMAGAYLAPNTTVLVFFILPMRLRTLAYVLVAVAVYTVLFHKGNAGGEAGHLGGALAGFYFIRHTKHLHGFFDFVGWADPTSHHYRHQDGGRARSRAMAKARTQAGTKMRAGGPDREAVDRILDKVHASGLGSLTEKEKRILREASERGR